MGKFELADGGTIFLDEIGELPIEMQVKLLRVIQERQICPVGGVRLIPVEFTIISATNRDLELMAEKGQFRTDLLYRIDVIRLSVPPLYERRDDISLIIEHYWEKKRRELKRETTLSPQARLMLEGYSWPGNVREVMNVVENLLATVRNRIVKFMDLPERIRQPAKGLKTSFPALRLSARLNETKRDTLGRALREAKGDRAKAAELMGVSRATLYRKLKEYGFLHKDDWRSK